MKRILSLVMSLGLSVLTSCVMDRQMKTFHSEDVCFSLLLPNNLKIIDSTHRYLKLVLDPESNDFDRSWSAPVYVNDDKIEIECLYLSDYVREHLEKQDLESYRYSWKYRLLKGNDGITYLPSSGIYAFKKQVDDLCYLFNSDGLKFTFNELDLSYNSLTQHQLPTFDMTAIGSIMLGCSRTEFNVQKAKFLRDNPRIGNNSIKDIYPTFVNEQLVAIRIVGEKRIELEYPATDWHKFYDQKYDRVPYDYSKDDVYDWKFMYIDGCKTIVVHPNLLYTPYNLLYMPSKYSQRSELRYVYPSIYIENSLVMDKVRREERFLEENKKADERQRTLDLI